MTKLKVAPEEAKQLGTSVTEKDKVPAISLEQKIIHDADCIEIIRTLLSNPDLFEQERLWLFKDQFPKPLLDQFAVRPSF